MSLRQVLSVGVVVLASACSSSEKQAPPAAATAPRADTEALDAGPQAPLTPKAERATGELRRALLLLRRVHFGLDSTALLPEAEVALRTAAEQLKRHPDVHVYVEGNADERGTAEYNVALGDRRARIVTGYLTRLGISADRLNPLSFGKEKPLVRASNAIAWALNRRVEFRLLRGDVELLLEEGAVVDDEGQPIVAVDLSSAHGSAAKRSQPRQRATPGNP